MRFLFLVALLSAAVSGMVSFAISLLLGNSKVSSVVAVEETDWPKPFVLLDTMHDFQRYMDKLYFSSQAENQPLASWYLWKLEQAAMQVIEHKTTPWYPPFVDERELFSVMLMPEIEHTADVVERSDWLQFDAAYKRLYSSCNNCHMATEHGYVVITSPLSSSYGNQQYQVPMQPGDSE